MVLLALLTILAACILIFIGWYINALNYWNKKGIYSPKPIFPFGNVKNVIFQKESLAEKFRDLYFDFKARGLRHGGAYFFAKPQYILVDLKLIKLILQNDYQFFNSHGSYINKADDPLSAHVFNLEGAAWKGIRTKLTPTFTSGKMKMMFQTIVDCTYKLEELLDECARMNPIDVKDVMGRFTTDIIGSCAFGLDIHSMKHADTDFRKYGIRFFEPALMETIKQNLVLFIPHSILRFFNFSEQNRDVLNFFYRIVEENVKYRENNNIHRKDFMHLLIQLKNKTDEESLKNKQSIEDNNFTIDDIAAQSFVFFLAGFETSSTTMNFASYELSVNSDVQEKARQEIKEVLLKHDNQLTYEGIMEMGYLDKVINETLRKYPPVPFLFRKCLMNYKVPDTDLIIEKGTAVQIPILGIHYDPEYFPDPEKFDPERFSEEAKSSRPQFTYLPFGEGPRVCIGMRFGLLQTKVGLITLLRNYKITLNKKTITPLVFKKTGLVPVCESGIWINLQKI